MAESNHKNDRFGIRKRAVEQMRAARKFAERIVETVRVPLLVLDQDLNIISADAPFHRKFGTTRGETENKRIYDLRNGQWNIQRLRELLEQIIPDNNSVDDFEVEHDFPGIGFNKMFLNAHRVQEDGDRPGMILLAIKDVTAQAQMQKNQGS